MQCNYWRAWLACVLAIAATLPGAAGLHDAPFGISGVDPYHWPLQKGNNQRTGFSPHKVDRWFKSGPSCTWKDPNLDVVRSTPLIDGESNIYISTLPGRVYKFSPECKVLWKFDTHGRFGLGGISMVPSLYKGKVVIVTKQAWLLFIDMESGRATFRTRYALRVAGDCYNVFAYNGTFVVPAVVDEEFLHPDPRNRILIGLDAETGAERWRFRPEAPVYNFQGCTDGAGALVFQDQSGGLYRLAVHDGRLLWRSGIRETTFFSTAASVVGGGMVFAVSNYGRTGLLHAYNLTDGAPLWRQALAHEANQAVALGPLAAGAGASVVLGIGQNPGVPPVFAWAGQLPVVQRLVHWLSLRLPRWFSRPLPRAMVAFEARTGIERWRYEMEPFQEPTCVGDSEHYWRRVAAERKNPDADTLCLPDSNSQPVIAGDGTVYMGWEDGKVYAVRDDDGNGVIDKDSELSVYDFGHAFQGSLGLGPGLLAVAPCGGGLWLFKS